MMSRAFIIAKEGRFKVLVALAVSLIFVVIDWEFLAFVASVTTALIAYSYRDPKREPIHYAKDAIASPCDGRVLAIKDVPRCDYFEGGAKQIEIDMSLLDMGYIRAPFDGKIEASNMTRGVKLSAYSALAHRLNERLELCFSNGERTVALKVVAQPSLEPFHLFVERDRGVLAGSNVALCIHSLAILYLPQSVRLDINVGDSIKASDTLLGHFA